MRAKKKTCVLLALLIATCSTAFAADDAVASDEQASRQRVTEAMPEPDAVLTAFNTDVERYAALYILVDRLAYRGDGSAAAMEKRQAYRRAMDRISPPSSTDAKFISERTRLQNNSQFRFDVINRFVPLLADEARGQIVKEQYEAAPARGLHHFWVDIGSCMLITLAFPLLLLVLVQRQLIRPRAPNADRAFQLPPQLAHIRVLWQSYFVTYDCGVITKRKSYMSTWTETTVIKGDPNAAPGPSQHDTILKSRREQQRFAFDLRTTDDRLKIFDFASHQLDVAAGDVVSVIERRGRLLLAHNHTKGTTEQVFSEARNVHGFSGTILWILGAAVGYVAFIQMDRIVGQEISLANGAVGAWMLITAGLLALWIAVLKSMVVRVRDRQFHRKWEPRLEAFMKEKTPALLQHFGDGKDWVPGAGR